MIANGFVMSSCPQSLFHSVNLHVLLQMRVGREFHFLFTGNVGKIFFCDKYFSGLWSEDAVTGTASMCPRGRLGVKPGTAYGASDRWRQSVLEASPPGGVLSPVVTGNSDSHSVHIAYDRDICCRPLLREYLLQPLCKGTERLKLSRRHFPHAAKKMISLSSV